MPFKCKIIFLYACSFLLCPLVVASPKDIQQPITIEADQAVLDEKKQTSIYTGNVVLKQGGIEVKANKITVYTNDGKLQSVVAEGDPVHYQQQQQKEEDIRGVSQRMEYEAESKRLLLLDGAELWQGGNRFSGQRIQYDPKEEKVIATGDSDGIENGAQRVQIILQPQSLQISPSEQKKHGSLKQQQEKQ